MHGRKNIKKIGHFTGDWVGPKAGLVGCGKSRLHRDSILGSLSPYLHPGYLWEFKPQRHGTENHRETPAL